MGRGGLLMEQANTHLGNIQLHKQHSIMIEGGAYPRSRVMDQMIFDRYLMEGVIDLGQHKAAESLLNMAAIAGMWARGARLDGTYVDGKKKSTVFFGMMPLGNALAKIRRHCGDLHHWFTIAVIIDNKDVRVKENGLRLFSESMDYVNGNILSFYRNPLKHLE